MRIRERFDPRAPCGARRRSSATRRPAQYFNPRAPCGARPIFLPFSTTSCRISTHAPLAGRDENSVIASRRRGDFNPRAPCGARRIGPVQGQLDPKFQPTRPLRGATALLSAVQSFADISTHAPLAGRDVMQPLDAVNIVISTHAPLAGRDGVRSISPPALRYFNPRAPCGARRLTIY